jgi:hypothetical protein
VLKQVAIPFSIAESFARLKGPIIKASICITDASVDTQGRENPDILCPSRLQAATATGIDMQQRRYSAVVCSGVNRRLQAAAP